MIQATVLEAQTRLAELVEKAQLGEKVLLTNSENTAPVAEIVVLPFPKERRFDLFHNPNFEIPADFDELDPEELRLWNGEGD